MVNRVGGTTSPPADADAPFDRETPTMAEFARALKSRLRALGDRRPKTGTLARRAGVSQSSLYAYLAGTTLPSAEILDDILAVVPLLPTHRFELVTLRNQVEDLRRGEPSAPTPPPAHIPDELPADPGRLFGRDGVFAALDAGLSESAVRLSVITLTGAAGVGKTAAVLSWGHRHRAAFPDGTVYVDLAGFSSGEPRDPGDVLAQVVRSLGVPEAEIPHRTVDRAGRLRSALAGRRLLLVLDNARDTEQVHDLLPGTAGPLVVVTSRDSLAGLMIEYGARSCPVLPLDALSSADVLRHSAPHLAHDEPAVATLARRCGGLPLALRLIGAQVHQRGEEPLTALVDRLGTGLDAFDLDTGRGSVREVLSWTEHRLTPAAARTLYLLATMPSAHCCVEGTAALLGKEVAHARAALRHLVRLHLIEMAGDGHFRMHDLVREFALERSREQIRPAESAAATQRVVDWVVDTGSRASTTFFHDGGDPNRADPNSAAPNSSAPVAGTPSATGRHDRDRVSPMDVKQAQVWLDQHTPLMIDLVRQAAAASRHPDTVRMVKVIRRLVVEGLLRHRIGLEMLEAGLDAAYSVGDLGTAGNLLRHLGWVHKMLGDEDRCTASLDASLELFRDLGDVSGEVNTMRVQASIHSMSGRLDEAVALYRRTLELGHASPTATATTHNNLAVCAGRAGDRRTALHHVRIALELHLSLGAGHAIARTRAQLAEICLHLGDLDSAGTEVAAALDWARTVGSRAVEVEALNVFSALEWARGEAAEAIRGFSAVLEGATELEDRYEQARACEGLAVAEHAAGDTDAAITLWRRSIRHYDAIGFIDADRVREQLTAVTRQDDEVDLSEQALSSTS